MCLLVVPRVQAISLDRRGGLVQDYPEVGLPMPRRAYLSRGGPIGGVSWTVFATCAYPHLSLYVSLSLSLSVSLCLSLSRVLSLSRPLSLVDVSLSLSLNDVFRSLTLAHSLSLGRSLALASSLSFLSLYLWLPSSR